MNVAAIAPISYDGFVSILVTATGKTSSGLPISPLILVRPFHLAKRGSKYLVVAYVPASDRRMGFPIAQARASFQRQLSKPTEVMV